MAALLGQLNTPARDFRLGLNLPSASTPLLYHALSPLYIFLPFPILTLPDGSFSPGAAEHHRQEISDWGWLFPQLNSSSLPCSSSCNTFPLPILSFLIIFRIRTIQPDLNFKSESGIFIFSEKWLKYFFWYKEHKSAEGIESRTWISGFAILLS